MCVLLLPGYAIVGAAVMCVCMRVLVLLLLLILANQLGNSN